MRELKRNKDGKKLYPICSWEENQHKLYNAYDRAMLNAYENDTWENVDMVEQALNAFDGNVIGGIVYATYEDGKAIKEYIWEYDLRH